MPSGCAEALGSDPVSSPRPFFAARVEASVNRRVEQAARRLGWKQRVIPYTGYGNRKRLRILGRLVLFPDIAVTEAAERFLRRRGWRNFVTVPCVRTKGTVTIGDREIPFESDREGYIDLQFTDHRLEPGWQHVRIRTEEAPEVRASVLVVGKDVTYGIVSDIDDTILSTWLPRPLIAAWNSFMRTEKARKSVAGMADMYTTLLAENPGAPIIYLSTGAWNTHPFLRRFIERYGFPRGPMLLTDWGPTNTGWFRSGIEHKRTSLRALARDFPKISWVLVGDDGQHDPMIYAEFAEYSPKNVRAIALRELNPVEQVLAHGTFGERLDTVHVNDEVQGVPMVRGPEGYTLLRKLSRLARPS